jgi:ribose transport system ATP-binding protein
LVGAGRSEIARAIFGADPLDTGTLLLNGKTLEIRNPKDSIRQGVCYLTEDRKLLGLFQSKSVRWNLASASLRRFVDRWGFYKWNDIKSASDEFSEKLDIRPRNDSLNVVSLSGGNQQKVLMGKWLSAKPKVLIVDEPTRGVDVGAKSQIHSLLREMADSGIGVIVISSEQPEVIGLCDRILVFCEGKMTKDFGNQAATQEEIMKYASGVTTDEVRS